MDFLHNSPGTWRLRARDASISFWHNILSYKSLLCTHSSSCLLNLFATSVKNLLKGTGFAAIARLLHKLILGELKL